MCALTCFLPWVDTSGAVLSVYSIYIFYNVTYILVAIHSDVPYVIKHLHVHYNIADLYTLESAAAKKELLSRTHTEGNLGTTRSSSSSLPSRVYSGTDAPNVPWLLESAVLKWFPLKACWHNPSTSNEETS